MGAWTELQDHIEELKLSRVQREIAHLLIQGVHTRDIAVTVGVSEIGVKLCATYLLHVLRRRPPDTSLIVEPFAQPPSKPGSAGAALKLPH